MAARHKLENAVEKEDGVVDVIVETREVLQGGSTGGAQPEVPEAEKGFHVGGVEAVSSGGVNREEGSKSNSSGEFKARKKKRRGGTQRFKGPKVLFAGRRSCAETGSPLCKSITVDGCAG